MKPNPDDWTPQAFRAWLLQARPDARVGMTANAFRCPLAQWLTCHVYPGLPVSVNRLEVAAHPLQPRKRKVFPVPDWMVGFIERVDNDLEVDEDRTVTAAQALVILNEMEETHVSAH